MTQGFKEELENWKKEELKEYCLNECLEHPCCTRAYIDLKHSEKELFSERDVTLFLGINPYVRPPCPKFKDGRCIDWDKPEKRPEICKRFPTFYIMGTLFVSNKCEIFHDMESEAYLSLQRICDEHNVDINIES